MPLPGRQVGSSWATTSTSYFEGQATISTNVPWTRLIQSLEKSPDLTNISLYANCTESERLLILQYDQSKFREATWNSDSNDAFESKINLTSKNRNNSAQLELVDSAIPIICVLLSIISLIINVIFVYLVIKGLRDKILPFKGYSLLLNRSVTDIITTLLTLIFVSLHKLIYVQGNPEYPKDDRNMTVYEVDYLIPHGRTLFTLLLTANFWSAAGAYAVLALFTYFAVRHPMFYIVKVTDRRTVYVMIGVWAVGIIYSILVVSISSNNAFNVFNDVKDLIQWNVSSEDYVLSIFNLFIVLISFAMVSISYVTIMIYLWRKSRESGNANLHLMSIGRLALNIFAYTITCVVMAGFVAIPLFLKGHISFLIEELKESQCKTLVAAYKLSYQMAQWSTVALTGWLLRMTIDPVANLLLDARFKLIYEPFCESISGTVIRNASPTANDFLRKCADANIMPSSILGTEGRYFRFRSASTVSGIVHEKEKKGKRNLRRFENFIRLNERVL